jgi:hypothetical protein
MRNKQKYVTGEKLKYIKVYLRFANLVYVLVLW